MLQLFDTTLRHFLRSLSEVLLAEVPEKIQSWYKGQGDGCFGPRGTEKSDQLTQLAKITRRLIVAFAPNTEVAASEPYKLLELVFDEHCEVERQENLSTPKKEGKRRKKRFIETVRIRPRKGSNLQSLFDPNVGYGNRGSGYSVHVTETCHNEDKPEILTDYEVREAGRSDVGKADGVVERLNEQGCMPKILYADAGYTMGQSILNLRGTGTELHAPTHRARLPAGNMLRSDFIFDESQRVALCPQGHAPIDRRQHSTCPSGPSVHAIFDGEPCRRCPLLKKCPVRALTHPGKKASLRETRGDYRLDVHPRLVARDLRIAEQQTDAFREHYRIRAGVEATMSELKRAHGLGKLRVRRLPRVLFAVAANGRAAAQS